MKVRLVSNVLFKKSFTGLQDIFTSCVKLPKMLTFGVVCDILGQSIFNCFIEWLTGHRADKSQIATKTRTYNYNLD